MEQAQKKINVVIAGRSFPVKVTNEEERSVRNIEKEINSKIHDYQLKYADKDKLDLVIMVLLKQSFDLEKFRSDEADTQQIHSQIDTLESTLDQLL